jgi:hypothetical protein
MGIEKKIWTHEGPLEKKKKKVGHMKVQEKKKKDIAMSTKESK